MIVEVDLIEYIVSWLQRVLLYMYMYNPGSQFLRILKAYMAQSYMCTCTMYVVIGYMCTCTMYVVIGYMCTCTMYVVIGYMYMIVCINILFTPDVLRVPSFHPPHTLHVPPLTTHPTLFTTHTSHIPPTPHMFHPSPPTPSTGGVAGQ